MVPSQKELDRERGSAMVEFALVLPILILIIFGVIQFGLVFNMQLTLDNAARQAARMAALPNPQPDTQIIASVIGWMPAYITLAANNIAISPAVRSTGQPVTVTITYSYSVPVTMGVLPDHYNLTAKAVMMAGI